ncbi:MAG: hypothetical protein ACYC5O_09075 [Anaerolineae bacterium]
MSCKSTEQPPADRDAVRREQMGEAVRSIVVTRERTPRNPRWAAAWRRTLFRYVDELERLKRRQNGEGG